MKGRILAIDYGKKRTGIAVSDPLQIIANGLTTIETPKLMDFLTKYLKEEKVVQFVIGEPKNMDDSDTHATPLVRKFVVDLKKQFPDMPIEMVDERFTSKEAMQVLIKSGVPRMKRRNKALLDEVSATIILQEYMNAF